MADPQALPTLNPATPPPTAIPPKEPTTEPKGQKPEEPKDPSQQAPRDWEKSFKGLQRTTQTQAEELKTIASTLAAIQKGLAPPESNGDQQQPEQPETIEGQLALLSQQVTGLSTELQEEQILRQEKELETRKLQMLSETPDLLPFSDTIATIADREAQVEAIEAFSTRLTAFTDAKKKTPSTPPVTKTPSQPQLADPQITLEAAQKAWSEAVNSKQPKDVIEKARGDFMKASDESNYLPDWAYQDR